MFAHFDNPEYGLGLFIYLPFASATAGALVMGRERSPSLARSVFCAVLTNLALMVVLLCFALEGILCLVMASPLLLIPTAVGGVVGHLLRRRSAGKKSRISIGVVLMALSPVIMGAESAARGGPPLRRVETVVVVEAPIERVWECVVEFPDIDTPPPWYFLRGIAYPLSARIEGRGIGAVRYCDFSTGAFVEPIVEWDPPQLLRFDVVESPAPLEEWNPWAEWIGWDVHPPHLDHSLQSKRGEFRLEDLGDGRTRLTGTTWYTLDLAPEPYWGWWSDAIIHRIHNRVLEHIGRVAKER